MIQRTMLSQGHPYFIVGDVHGDYHRLEMALADACELNRCTVMLGDYINRGPNSRAVIDLMLSAKAQMGEDLILLRGNHEAALLDFLDSGDPGGFLLHGGLSTIRDYVGHLSPVDVIDAFRANFPSDHRELLLSTRLYVEDDSTLISHCGFNPADIGDRGEQAMVRSSFPEIFSECSESLGKLSVFGHYVQRTGRPWVSDRIICLDVGCGTIPGRPLAAVQLPERIVTLY